MAKLLPSRSYLLAAAAAGSAVSPWSGSEAAQRSGSCQFALVAVTVVNRVQDQAWPNQTIVLENGIPAVIGEAGTVRVPSGAIRVDGSGRTFDLGGLRAAGERRCEPPVLGFGTEPGRMR